MIGETQDILNVDYLYHPLFSKSLFYSLKITFILYRSFQSSIKIINFFIYFKNIKGIKLQFKFFISIKFI